MDRRGFLRSSCGVTAYAVSSSLALPGICRANENVTSAPTKMRFGLVTYMWGADWDLPTLIANCQKAHAEGVELRTEHAHKVEPDISTARRKEVKQMFADSPVTLVGLGTNQDFHHVDQAKLRGSIDRAKEFIKLGHDVGGSGVKVKPNDLPKEVPQEKTIAQIGKALNELGAFGEEFGQQIRLEVHGGCAHLPTIAAIMKMADHPNVAVCWNSNAQDLQDGGLEENFRLVQSRLGATMHVHNLGGKEYPYPRLFKLLKDAHYKGWILIEASDKPADRVAALAKEREAFERLVQSNG
jgi:sugar phosphate isomerase/epimerase